MRANLILQTLHSWGFSPVWIRRWVRSLSALANCLWQTPHWGVLRVRVSLQLIAVQPVQPNRKRRKRGHERPLKMLGHNYSSHNIVLCLGLPAADTSRAGPWGGSQSVRPPAGVTVPFLTTERIQHYAFVFKAAQPLLFYSYQAESPREVESENFNALTD